MDMIVFLDIYFENPIRVNAFKNIRRQICLPRPCSQERDLVFSCIISQQENKFAEDERVKSPE